MGKTYEALDDKLIAFIEAQKLFFIATAPDSGDGLVNLSPKGFETLRVLDSHTLAYLDLTGSGVETVAHLKDNGRFVLMFCSFEDKPMILRLHGRGEALERGSDEFDRLLPLFPDLLGTRTIIKLEVERIADSCGWGVPLYEYQGQRDTYPRYVEQKGAEGIREGQLKGNMTSLDGMTGLSAPSY